MYFFIQIEYFQNEKNPNKTFIPPTCKLCVILWPPLDVSTGGY